MLLARAGIIAAAGGAVAPPVAVDYAPNAVIFDGSTDFLTDVTGLNGATDTKFFSAVFAIKRLALSGAGLFQRIAGGQIGTAGSPGATRWSVGFEPSDHATRPDALYFDLRDPAGTLLAYVNSTIPFLTGVWYRVGISANRSVTPRVYQIRVDNVDRTAVAVTDHTDTALFIDFTTELASIGGRYQGDQRLNAEVADLVVYFSGAIDFNVAAEWERFFAPTTHALKFKGNDGSAPYGGAPAIFMSGPTAFWHQNRGFGEGFVLQGALATSADPPEGAPMESFALSDVGITATGTNAVVHAQGADNWPVAWASDGNQVASWGDGSEPRDTNDADPSTTRASLGFARINSATYAAFVADHDTSAFFPLATTRSSGRGAGVNLVAFSATPPNVAAGTARGGKCYGLQALPGGVLYALVGAQGDDDGNASGTQVPEDQMENVTLIKSADNGATWTHIPAISWNVYPSGAGSNWGWVLPAALNMGRANGAAQDEYLYWYAAGARPGYTGQDVATGFAFGSANVMLVRVLASAVETLANWQVFTGMSGSTPQWSSTFTAWAPVPGDDGNGWTLNNNTEASPNQANNQYPNVFYLSEFDEIVLVRNTAARHNWAPGTGAEIKTDLEFWRSTSRKPWGPFALVERITGWKPYDPDVPGEAAANRSMFFFSVAPRWVPKATGTTTRSIATALIYTGRNKGASGTFWDAWNSVPMTLTLTAAAGPALSAPVNTVLPTISPTSPGVDTEVTAADGTWTGNPTPTFTYQWLTNGANISGATAQTYIVTTADRDAAQPSLAVRVTATNSQGSASATSDEIAVVTSATMPVWQAANFNSSSPFAPTYPASIAAGDLLLAIACSVAAVAGDPSGFTATLPTDFVSISGSPWTLPGSGTGGRGLKLWVGSKIATGAETGAATFTMSTTDSICSVARISGGHASGLIEGIASLSGVDRPVGNPSVTSTAANRLGLLIAVYGDDATAFVDLVGGSGPTWTIRAQHSEVSGGDRRLGIWTASLATAATTSGHLESAVTGAENWLAAAFAVRPTGA